MSYPPEPWHLRGQMYLSVWSVPRSELPPLPEGLSHVVRPVTLGGRGLVGTAWIEYQPGGVLQYRELLTAVLVRARARTGVTITDIWVDSPVSRDGGRELWGIPKEMADLEIAAETVPTGRDVIEAAAHTASRMIAQGRVQRGMRLPGRWPFRFTVTQLLISDVRSTPVRGRAGLTTATARWTIEPGGPMGRLAHRRPMITLALRDFQLTFGTAGGQSDGATGEGPVGPDAGREMPSGPQDRT
ncbi:acetoacetate decarboxylase family protein [Micromonospora polyrhachis]|uniref:Acetoacetate decarboxylase n=1 Tax=Micromonospora polyrhachis TaxID=1282883 RepID=A0A7W7WM74_9ACTN|nr:acetoacetate decarboxylase family protein [Micromonospora polyrhachis]MBB4956327.1 hypothetical protein [Micromonospora polyrhachis]